MKVVGVCGSSGSGKTTLLEALVAELRRAGQRVSVIKHAHVGFDLDRPGKDSFRLREAGAFEVLVASPNRLALMREFGAEIDLNVHQLLRELVDVDWVLVEGFKDADIMKVEVWRAEVATARGDVPIYPEDPFVVAIATDRPDALPVPTLRPVVALGDAPALLAALHAAGDRLHYDASRHG
jgi:molybdopterin-guanine dinucleotide biosynthesis protein B